MTAQPGSARSRLAGAFLLALWLIPVAAVAQEGAPSPGGGAAQAPSESASGDDGRRTVARLPVNLFRGAIGVFSLGNLKPLLVGGAAAGIGAIFDDEVADALANPDHDFGKALEAGGAPVWTTAVVGTLFVAGRFSGSSRFRAATYDWLDAAAVNAAYTEVLKIAVGRERPNGEDNKSFPSGHASNAFTLATVAQIHFGWKVGVPAYGVAAAVALSRLQREKHYLSDVLAGSTLGYIVGRTVVRVNSQPFSRRTRSSVSISPVVARRTRAVVVSLAF